MTTTGPHTPDPHLARITRRFRELGRRVRADSDLDITLEVGAFEESGRLDPELETLVFRIVQEALNNVARHADAGRAGVRLLKAGDRFPQENGPQFLGSFGAPVCVNVIGDAVFRDRFEAF